MKRLLLIAAVAGLFVVLFSFFAGDAKACGRCADPQVCINSQLLNIAPSAQAQAYVVVPDDATVDFNIANCGGTGEVLDPSHVFTGGNKIVVTVLTLPKAAVTTSYGDQSFTKSSPLGIDVFKFNLP